MNQLKSDIFISASSRINEALKNFYDKNDSIFGSLVVNYPSFITEIRRYERKWSPLITYLLNLYKDNKTGIDISIKKYILSIDESKSVLTCFVMDTLSLINKLIDIIAIAKNLIGKKNFFGIITISKTQLEFPEESKLANLKDQITKQYDNFITTNNFEQNYPEFFNLETFIQLNQFFEDIKLHSEKILFQPI